ncbi:Cyclic nucleotide-binding protein [Pseudocohnilembus persalinus]|uniref:Cyclic nucleotide-binding protein n=1 Tax=Pseudocohnilembus persalinus TaxID=266149 RepID=A0A0V0QU09_PSEPJ|nr:Cyclic nucleotide-binding protein [Pseudocohnilembus persalinus]|eukprot:KRX05691.1 Cyclic nucleotide-binding protein [Pseudocohnilembus persalinus]
MEELYSIRNGDKKRQNMILNNNFIESKDQSDSQNVNIDNDGLQNITNQIDISLADSNNQSIKYSEKSLFSNNNSLNQLKNQENQLEINIHQNINYNQQLKNQKQQYEPKQQKNFDKKKFSLVDDKASSYDILRSQDTKHIDYPSKIVKWRYFILLKFKPFLDLLNYGIPTFEQEKDISQNYLRYGFKYDFIVIVPYFLIKSTDLQYADIILLLRTNKIFRLGNDLFYKWCQNEKKQAIFNLVRLVFIVIFVSHFMGCIFVFFAYIEEDSYGIENTWLKQYQETSRYQEKWYEDYVVSLYWAVITMITVGYDAFLRALALHMKEKRFGPQTIISDNTTENSLYFVMDGTVSIYNLNIDLKKQSRKLLKIAGKNEIFNELRFLNDCTENLEIESNEMVEITYITKYDFLVQLKNFPLDYERYRQINDQLCVQQIYKGLSLKCDICASHMHTTNNCCFIHYTESKEKIIKQNSFKNREQMRNISFKRLDKAILIQDYLKEVVLQYIIDNDEASEDETLEKIQNILNYQNEYEQFNQEIQNQCNPQSQLKRFKKLDIRELIQSKQLISEGLQNNGIIISKDKEHREKRKSETQENILNMWRNQQSQKKSHSYQVDTSKNHSNYDSQHNQSQRHQKILTATNLQSSQSRIESLNHINQSKSGKEGNHIKKIMKKLQNDAQSKNNSNNQINQMNSIQITEESQNQNSDNEYNDNINKANSWQKNLTNINSSFDQKQEQLFKTNNQFRQIFKNQQNLTQSISTHKDNSKSQAKREKQNQIMNSFVNSLKSLRSKRLKNTSKPNTTISQDKTETLLQNNSYGIKSKNEYFFNSDTNNINDYKNFTENTNNFFLKSKWTSHTDMYQFFILPEFDICKNFKIYYPHNNCSVILEKFLNCQKKKYKVDFSNRENRKAKDKQKLQALVLKKKKSYSKMVMSKPMHRKIHNNLTQIKQANLSNQNN